MCTAQPGHWRRHCVRDSRPISIVGAGPTGALLAILLQRRALGPVGVYESRPDLRSMSQAGGRTINLALADRGIHALKTAGIFETLGAALLPMRGRLVHHHNGRTAFQPYGQRPNEVIYSVSRHRLNQALLDAAGRLPGIKLHFEHRFETADFAAGNARIRNLKDNRALEVPMQPLIAADGAGSLLRRAMGAQNLIDAREQDLEHGYKELSIPADAGGGYLMRCDALHIWPRGNFMLIALPNEDGSFTATLFLAKRGPTSFESLQGDGAIDEFLSRNFPDVRELMPNCVAEFKARPVGFLGTVYAAPWHTRGAAALIGDAAHAMVPFHGQGMNCCFEDCIEFDACLDRHDSWEAVFAEFDAARKPNTDAIAAMALENYLEMRESVADPKFQLQQALALELERRFPRRFIPRYAMVMFHHEIPYQTALKRGAAQSEILANLAAGAPTALSDVDFESAERQVNTRLPPL
jgi:kynurenine 3-monooxygenase